MDTPVRITRSIDLDLSPAELWALIADGDRWQDWLVDGGALDVRPGGSGTVVDDGEPRQVCVRTVEHGERVTFDWWTDEDMADRSHVELEIVTDGDRTGLHVTETLASATTSVACDRDPRPRWEVRLLALHLASCALIRT